MLTEKDCTELVQERHADYVAEAVNDRATALKTARLLTLSKYTQEQQAAALHLYLTVKRHVGTSGGNTLAKVLLGLYNGPRFPFDLTDLRLLDADNFIAAMTVIHMDSRHTWCEIQVLLDAILGEGADTGAEFEHWAYNLKLKGRCKADQLPDLRRIAVAA